MVSFIKSPLNYTGGKYKLLPQVYPLIEEACSSSKYFVDLFSGGLNVGVNSPNENLVVNDLIEPLINLYRFIHSEPLEFILASIDNTIDLYGLTNSSKYGRVYETLGNTGYSRLNKEGFNLLRSDYNKTKDPLLFFILVTYSFNNQIRFNSKGEFNLPVNKTDYSPTIRKNLELFAEKLKSKFVTFNSYSYEKVIIPDSSFVYVDPPYLISTASYNESNGWNSSNELSLLEYLGSLSSKGIKFALSNVTEHKGMRNDILLDWLKNYNVHYLNYSYSNNSYHKKDENRSSVTSEVLITNF